MVLSSQSLSDFWGRHRARCMHKHGSVQVGNWSPVFAAPCRRFVDTFSPWQAWKAEYSCPISRGLTSVGSCHCDCIRGTACTSSLHGIFGTLLCSSWSIHLIMVIDVAKYFCSWLNLCSVCKLCGWRLSQVSILFECPYHIPAGSILWWHEATGGYI
jgi:hypothetical protein